MNTHKKTLITRSGFTLVEMLVVIGIFGIILAGVLKVFDTSNYTYKVQEEIAEMQQNVRVSKMFLERDIRMAGCGLNNVAMGTNVLSGSDIINSRAYAVEFLNGSGENGSDIVEIKFLNFDEGECGTDPSTTPAISCDDLNTLTLTNDMPVSSTVAIVYEDLVSDPSFTDWNENCYCGRLYTHPTPGYSVIITTPDGLKSDVVFVTQVTPHTNHASTISNGANFTADDGRTYDNKIFNSYPAGSTISFFNRNTYTKLTYYIQNRRLMRDREVRDPADGSIDTITETVAVNIEDLQFRFGLDPDADGDIDSWVGESGGDPDLTGTEREHVRLVEINVLGRTSSEHRGHSEVRPAILDNAAGSTADGFRRKQLQVTVKVRNLGL